MGDDILDISTEKESFKNKIGSDDEKWLEEPNAKLLKQTDDVKRANSNECRLKNRWRNNRYLAYISFTKLWESECYNLVSKRDKIQDLKNIQLKLEVPNIYQKVKK